MEAPEPNPEDQTEAFLLLLTEHEKRLAIYVTGLVACPQDAQDILQEGKIVMWRNFKAFELGTNFPAWSRKILFHQILAYRRKSKRMPTSMLNEATLEILNEASESAIREKRWVKREAALQVCLRKMGDEHRDVVHMRYRDEASIEKIAHRIDRTEGAVYRLLSRLRQNLYECVESETEQA
jgi:RNA polymerase sigma-70 factor (ECF subfamily)